MRGGREGEGGVGRRPGRARSGVGVFGSPPSPAEPLKPLAPRTGGGVLAGVGQTWRCRGGGDGRVMVVPPPPREWVARTLHAC